MVYTVPRYELARVLVVAVPSLFTGIQRTRIRISLGAKIEDGIDCAGCTTVTDSDHNSILVRAYYAGDTVQHSML